MTTPVSSLITAETRLKVSSVLNRDNTTYGKKHLIDNNEETCWYSDANKDQDSSQYIIVNFAEPAVVQEIIMTFQGGFVGKKTIALGSRADSPDSYNIEIGTFYPKDNNILQRFTFEPTEEIRRLKIVFAESTDFYGRIVLYKLDILGRL